MSQITAGELSVLTSKLVIFSFLEFQTLCKEQSDTGAKLIKICVRKTLKTKSL